MVLDDICLVYRQCPVIIFVYLCPLLLAVSAWLSVVLLLSWSERAVMQTSCRQSGRAITCQQARAGHTGHVTEQRGERVTSRTVSVCVLCAGPDDSWMTA